MRNIKIYVLYSRIAGCITFTIIMFLAPLFLTSCIKTNHYQTFNSGLQMQEKGPNHYQTLNVTRESNPLQIKRAYKKLSLSLHPDKNPSPNASDEFDEVKQAYDILMDMEFREVYNKFGQDGINSNKRFEESQFFMELGIFYLTWGMMAYVLTLGKKSGDARQWTFTGIIIMLVVEIAIMTSQTNPIPTSLFPTWTEHEVVWLLHTLFPAFMNGCRSLGSYLYVDLDKHTRQLLLALQEQNKDILLVLRDVQITTQSIQANGGASTGGGAVGTPVVAGPMVGATPTGKIREMQQKLQASNSQVTAAVNDLKSEGGAKSNMGFYVMIIGYIAMSYLFK